MATRRSPADRTSLRGVLGACLTPFAGGYTVDRRALAAQIDHLVRDVDAIAVGAVEASEYGVLDETARQDLLQSAISEVDGRVPVVVGASAGSLDTVTGWCETAAELGADVAQVLVPANPWGGEPNPEELLEYFGEVTARSPLPVLAYHNPARGADPPIGTLVDLCRLEGVVAFKESSRDMTKIARLVADIDLAGHAAYLTTMQPMLITLVLGGSGAAVPPPATRIAGHIRDAMATGDLARATAWAQLFAYFPAMWAQGGLATVMKAAMRHAGVDIGGPAPPFAPLAPEADAALGRFVTGCGLLDGEPAPPERLRELATR